MAASQKSNQTKAVQEYLEKTRGKLEFQDGPTDHPMGKDDVTSMARKPLNCKLQTPPGDFGLQVRKVVTILARIIHAHKHEMVELFLYNCGR